ncbi:hypothetical protein [Arenibacterium sp. LLYu02]|uniref:hypothetical protein n=1 Tax=Arenibacterium sp. LLYu02 TaxID=3404132 RepID=UPI003B21DB1F
MPLLINGLLGMLAGEAAEQLLRSHQNVVAQVLHTKSFAVKQARPASEQDLTRPL